VEKVLASVKVGAGKLELRDFPMPQIDEESALLKMEVAGICGTDVKMFKQPLSGGPVIMGHENIGGGWSSSHSLVIAIVGSAVLRAVQFGSGRLLISTVEEHGRSEASGGSDCGTADPADARRCTEPSDAWLGRTPVCGEVSE